VRVLRGASGKSVYEESLKPAKSGAISIRLRGSALRRALGPGLYAIEVTAGRSATNRHSRAYASYGSRRPDHTTSPIGRRGEGVWRLQYRIAGEPTLPLAEPGSTALLAGFRPRWNKE
jgi:hypothetical protein